MPTIPLYGEAQVAPGPTTGARLDNSASLEDFGGGASAEGVTRAAQAAGNEAMQIAATTRRQTNDVAVLDADKKLNDAETTAVYDPKAGLLAKRGKDVLGAYPVAMTAFKSAADKIASGLSNEEQRISFSHLVNARQYTIERVGQRHVAEQLKSFDDETTSTSVKNAQDMALKNFNDPLVVNAQIDKQRAILTDYAGRQGLPADWVEEKTTDAVSKTHTGVISQMLAAQQDVAAEAYYKKNKDDVSGPDQISAERALQEGTLRGESQRQADAIVGDADDQPEALEAARDIKDPKLRDMTTERINQHYSQNKAALRNAQDDVYQKSALLVDQNPTAPVRDLVDPSAWTSMTAEQREALQRRSENPPNNDKRWLDFIDLSPTQLAAMKRPDFETVYWANFDAAHRSRAESMWEAGQQGKHQSAALASTLTFNQRVDETLRTSGVIPADLKRSDFSKDQATTYAQFDQQAAHQIEQFELTQLGGKRKATGDEMQKVLDDMVIKKVFVNKPWYQSDVSKPAATLTADESGRAYVPIANVPAADKNAIQNLILSKQKRVTTDKVQRAYAAYLTGDRSRFNAVLGE